MLSILVPYRADGAERDRNWAWVRKRLELVVPDSEIVVGQSPDGPFSPSAAVNDAALRANGETFCIHDADAALPVPWYRAARELDGWTIPAGSKYLTEVSTQMLLRVVPNAPLPNGLQCVHEMPFSVGGVVMLSRETFFEIGGKDERFTSWGPEDAALSLALEALGGTRNRFGAQMLHLHHPTLGDARPWPEGAPELMARYQAAAGDPEAMREVLVR